MTSPMWVLPTISETLALAEPGVQVDAEATVPAKAQSEREWQGVIAAMNQLLSQTLLHPEGTAAPPVSGTDAVEICPAQGLLLSGPMPVMGDPLVLAHLQAWTFTPGQGPMANFQLLPGGRPPDPVPSLAPANCASGGD